MLLSAVSVLVVAQSSSEIPEGLMNNPVYLLITRKVMPTECHNRTHSNGTVRGPVLRLSNKCEPDLPKSHLPYIFPAFTVAYPIPELRWKL